MSPKKIGSVTFNPLGKDPYWRHVSQTPNPEASSSTTALVEMAKFATKKPKGSLGDALHHGSFIHIQSNESDSETL